MESKKIMWKYFRFLFSLMILGTQLILWIDSWTNGSLEALNFFGYWTNQGNILGAIALLISAKYTLKDRPFHIEIIRFIATVNIVMVTVLYWSFVNGDDVGVRFLWANYMVHLITGLILLADWIIEGPKISVQMPNVYIAGFYPLFWLIVTGIRFLIDGWVPYAVLEPKNGFISIAVICLIFFISSFVFGTILILLKRFRILKPSL
ncbi:Pr6Pr family membrane protein [Spirochaeta cellobiosiphila]|uniref:Pr6Pr family membrane protein n=1 Tax=Spirochaeta cellobiosiphila TaxID=504483 RepID=UPI000421D02B|nr:Pr6Pr family membrane protein [Spirochaeta cellobiosiphila]